MTEGNPWYFRTIFSDDREGEFLTSYARDVLGASGIAVVRTPNRYAERMAGVIRREAAELGLPIRADWGGDPLAADAAGRAGVTAGLGVGRDAGGNRGSNPPWGCLARAKPSVHRLATPGRYRARISRRSRPMDVPVRQHRRPR